MSAYPVVMGGRFVTVEMFWRKPGMYKREREKEREKDGEKEKEKERKRELY